VLLVPLMLVVPRLAADASPTTGWRAAAVTPFFTTHNHHHHPAHSSQRISLAALPEGRRSTRDLIDGDSDEDTPVRASRAGAPNGSPVGSLALGGAGAGAGAVGGGGGRPSGGIGGLKLGLGALSFDKSPPRGAPLAAANEEEEENSDRANGRGGEEGVVAPTSATHSRSRGGPKPGGLAQLSFGSGGGGGGGGAGGSGKETPGRGNPRARRESLALLDDSDEEVRACEAASGSGSSMSSNSNSSSSRSSSTGTQWVRHDSASLSVR
jgi:hypothetical protein